MLQRRDVVAIVDDRVRVSRRGARDDERPENTEAVGATLRELERSLRGLLQQQHETLQSAISNKAELSSVDSLRRQLEDLVAVVERMHSECEARHKAAADNDQRDNQQAMLLKVAGDVRTLRSHVDVAPRRQELDAICEQLRELRATLRSELFQARFIWREGRRCPTTRAVQWDVQALNTHADVFAWEGHERHAERVVTTIPGLYQLHVAFFSGHAPRVTVLVNGEPALSVDDESSSPSDPAAESLAGVRRFRHSAGNLVGYGASAFLALPSRAALSVTCDVDDATAQGFLHLRKM
ncbi:hypothetical protein ATCC90586_009279 [Pythium insidiosum]|nr:hypothetical protein ATCC90586_009279 [Pythium insidiosum]